MGFSIKQAWIWVLGLPLTVWPWADDLTSVSLSLLYNREVLWGSQGLGRVLRDHGWETLESGLVPRKCFWNVSCYSDQGKTPPPKQCASCRPVFQKCLPQNGGQPVLPTPSSQAVSSFASRVREEFLGDVSHPVSTSSLPATLPLMTSFKSHQSPAK